MKILVAGLSKEKGGIGSLLLNVAKCNKDSNGNKIIDFEFLVPEDSVYYPILESEGYICYTCPRIRQVLKYSSFLKKVFQKEHYDFVWIHNTSKVDILLPIIARNKAGARVIQHAHGTDMEASGVTRALFSLLEKLYGKKYENLIDVPLACSASAADYFYKTSDKRKMCTVFTNGIFTDIYSFDLEKRNLLRQRLNIGDDRIVLGTVGRLTAVKNNQYITKLMDFLPEKYICIMLGEGEDRTMLEQVIKEHGLNKRIFLLGNRDNVNEYLSAMDILLMPSLNEGMPFSLIEAQASGLECIVSDGVSEEANITGNVHFVNLDKVDNWVSAIIKVVPKTKSRKDMNRVISENGYDINSSYLSFLKLLEQSYKQEGNNAL